MDMNWFDSKSEANMLENINHLKDFSEKLEGKKISEIASKSSLEALNSHWNKVKSGEIKYMSKSTINDIIENDYFKVPKNSSELPDIALEDGNMVELKVSHLFTKRGLVRPEYRLVLKMLNYEDMANNSDWRDSKLYKKMKYMIIVLYYKDDNIHPADWIVTTSFLWSASDYNDEIQRDYEYTRNRVMEGKKISESQTKFLANCPKHNSKFCWWCHIKVKCENKRKGKIKPPHPVLRLALRTHPALGMAEKRGYCIPVQKFTEFFSKQIGIPIEKRGGGSRPSYGIPIEKMPYIDPKLHM